MEGGISGLKGIRDLSYKLIFTAINIKVENNEFDDFKNDEEEEERDKDAVKEKFDESLFWEKLFSSTLTETKAQSV